MTNLDSPRHLTSQDDVAIRVDYAAFLLLHITTPVAHVITRRVYATVFILQVGVDNVEGIIFKSANLKINNLNNLNHSSGLTKYDRYLYHLGEGEQTYLTIASRWIKLVDNIPSVSLSVREPKGHANWVRK